MKQGEIAQLNKNQELKLNKTAVVKSRGRKQQHLVQQTNY